MDTPFIMIELDILKRNIRNMADFAAENGIRLRPHIKAHKIVEIAMMQLKAGAAGITAAKLGEAEVMFAAGIKDILIAYPLVGQEKLEKVKHLLRQGCRLTLLVDSRVGAEMLNELGWPSGINVMVEVDSGLGRGGFLPGSDLEEFVQWIDSLKCVNFMGLLTFEGHAYGCHTADAVKSAGIQAAEMMVAAAEALRQKGISVEEISIGSTPTARWGGTVSGVTEIRPGNYVFNDATQVELGIAGFEDCSLKVISTVISRPAKNRALIDAGSKVLAKDGGTEGYGLFNNRKWKLTRLWEEHGLLEGEDLPEIGSIIEIIPNHACPVANLADTVCLSDGGKWKVAARGMSR